MSPAKHAFPQVKPSFRATNRHLSCGTPVNVAYLPDGILDDLPAPSQIGATRVGGIDLNRARMRHALHAVLTLSIAPDGFTVADHATRVQAITGQP